VRLETGQASEFEIPRAAQESSNAARAYQEGMFAGPGPMEQQGTTRLELVGFGKKLYYTPAICEQTGFTRAPIIGCSAGQAAPRGRA